MTYFEQFKTNANGVQLSFGELRELTFTVSQELISGPNATLIDSYNELLVQTANNGQNYIDGIFVIDQMIIAAEAQILSAIEGMVRVNIKKMY